MNLLELALMKENVKQAKEKVLNNDLTIISFEMVTIEMQIPTPFGIIVARQKSLIVSIISYE